MSADTPRRRVSLEEAASSVSVPPALRQAWNGPEPQITSSQVWRADWDHENLIVVILGTQEGIQAAPLSLDTEYADKSAVVIEESSSPLGVPLVAWPELAHRLPCVVFDRFAGELSQHTLEAIIDPKSSYDVDPNSTHPVRLYRAAIEDSIEALAAARWYEAGTGQLSTILRDVGVREIATALDVAPQRALALWRGQAALTRSEAERLSPLVDRPADALLAANPSPPSDLIARLDQPSRHRQVRAVAERRGVDLSTSYRDVAYQNWALAARQTGTQKNINWDLRLDTYFSVALHGE